MGYTEHDTTQDVLFTPLRYTCRIWCSEDPGNGLSVGVGDGVCVCQAEHNALQDARFVPLKCLSLFAALRRPVQLASAALGSDPQWSCNGLLGEVSLCAGALLLTSTAGSKRYALNKFPSRSLAAPPSHQLLMPSRQYLSNTGCKTATHERVRGSFATAYCLRDTGCPPQPATLSPPLTAALHESLLVHCSLQAYLLSPT